MKKQFTVPVTVTAYSQEDAEAKVELLLQLGAFLKDFNVNNLLGSIIQSFVISKVAELTEKNKLKEEKENRKSLVEIAFSAVIHSKTKQQASKP